MCVCGNELGINQAFTDQHMEDAVKQRNVGARLNRQVQVRQFAGIGAPWVDDDEFHLRATAFCFFQATKKNRVRVGHVAADDHHAIAQFDIFIAARRCVGAQAALVAGHGRRHAQP
ncbi:hypothetical protein ALO50_200135 [Pseudomonas syringae pv. cerasicola]|uniref:Uncharacterized protein n=1 Tax=Pseudomonas syringae pv. cerasicola TaxID=264451 RepID=A0A0P9NGI6_PSESX|nr:hypothetical protein ALO50_200135 [Pseudomonas syringae pv. cerasicola]